MSICAMASVQLRNLLREFKNDVQLKFVNFPLDKKLNPYTPSSEHHQAGLAAKAAICAASYGNFWQYHEELFHNQKDINLDLILALAHKHNWNDSRFCDCINSDQTQKMLLQQIEYGHQAKISSTPALFINGRAVKYSVVREAAAQHWLSFVRILILMNVLDFRLIQISALYFRV